MHPFRPATDLQFLVGDEIAQIALDPYGVQFRFSSSCQISVEHLIEHVDERGAIHSYECRATSEKPLYLHQLLQHRVSSVDVEALCLSLIFANEAILRIFTEIGPYESGQIYLRDGDFIVF